MKALKEELRTKYLLKRSRLSLKERSFKSRQICQHLAVFAKEYSYAAWFGFSSFRGEPDLEEFYRHFSSTLLFALPRVIGPGSMSFRRYTPGESLVTSALGIKEPASDDNHPVFMPTESTLILVPSVAIDRFGVRLGYGGGFYDRFLTHHSKAITMGVVFDDCFADKLPSEGHDQTLDYILTDKGLYSSRESLRGHKETF